MSNNPAKKPEWEKLSDHKKEIGESRIDHFFKEYPERENALSVKLDNIVFDFSKQHLTTETLDLLMALARSCNLEGKIKDLFEGKKVNTTENRAALHTALRQGADTKLELDGEDIIPAIQKTLHKMKSFSEAIRAGKQTGSTGKPLTKIIALGTGGSSLGPQMVCNALETGGQGPEIHFVTNADSDDLQKALRQCDPEETLFIIISKSFKTRETIMNAHSALQWLEENLPKGSNTAKHFAAISMEQEEAAKFGIAEENFFPMWEWVNGRFSLWSTVGLPICIRHGFDTFKLLLEGARDTDRHFAKASFEKNIPVLMAMIGIWNRNFLNSAHHGIFPYAQKMALFPTYLQQLDMESNGKSVDLDGEAITDYKTCPVVFGDVGTNSQHSFYQLLHQGSETIPCDFIGFSDNNTEFKNHKNFLLHNMLAQGQAFMQGSEDTESPHKNFAGNKPSSTLLINDLNAHTLGMLIALYEHKCFVQGVIWNINSFDQFGVELGKTLADHLESGDLSTADPSTKQLYSLVHKSDK